VVVKISPEDREKVKSTILGLMLNTPKQLQKILSAALEYISECDFPQQWPTLLPVCLTAFVYDYELFLGIDQGFS
jgi:hypothetical protein